MTRSRLLLAVLLGLAGADPAAAQSVTGAVVESGSGRPLPGALVVLQPLDGRPEIEVVAGDSGFFRFPVRRSGEYRLLASFIGYADVTTEPFDAAMEEDVVVELRMAVEAVPLEPLVVRSRDPVGGQIGEFYERMARNRRTGFGHFVAREQIEGMAAFQTTDLLRTIPGVRVVPGRGGRGAGVRMRGGCVPALYVDGMQINRPPLADASIDELVTPQSIEGVEVYRGSYAHVGGYYDDTGCGLVLVWTRRGQESSGPWSWGKLLTGIGLILGLAFLVR